MVIALLISLGVDLAVIVALLIGLLMRRRWLARQPGIFSGAMRQVGESPGKWRRGRGRWVGDVLVWSRAPSLLHSSVLQIIGSGDDSHAAPETVKRVKDPVVASMTAARGESLELAASGKDMELLLGPWSTHSRGL